MKKLFLSITILASSVAAFAQTNVPSTSAKADTEQTASANKGKKADRKGQKAINGKKDKDTRAFEGINLTEEQRTKLTALRTNLKNERKAGKENAGKDQNPKMTPEQKKAMKAERSAKHLASKKAYLAGVKEILTPDQYVMFLENSYTISKHDKKGQRHGKDMRSGKGGKKGNRDQKSETRTRKQGGKTSV